MRGDRLDDVAPARAGLDPGDALGGSTSTTPSCSACAAAPCAPAREAWRSGGRWSARRRAGRGPGRRPSRPGRARWWWPTQTAAGRWSSVEVPGLACGVVVGGVGEDQRRELVRGGRVPERRRRHAGQPGRPAEPPEPSRYLVSGPVRFAPPGPEGARRTGRRCVAVSGTGARAHPYTRRPCRARCHASVRGTAEPFGLLAAHGRDLVLIARRRVRPAGAPGSLSGAGVRPPRTDQRHGVLRFSAAVNLAAGHGYIGPSCSCRRRHGRPASRSSTSLIFDVVRGPPQARPRRQRRARDRDGVCCSTSWRLRMLGRACSTGRRRRLRGPPGPALLHRALPVRDHVHLRPRRVPGARRCTCRTGAGPPRRSGVALGLAALTRGEGLLMPIIPLAMWWGHVPRATIVRRGALLLASWR